MRIRKAVVFSVAALFLWCVAAVAQGQQFDLLIKGGHVIDPRNQIDAVMDVAITADKISQVAANIPAAQAKQVINAAGLYVTPGMVDLHVHSFYGTQPYANYAGGNSALPPDGFTFRAGVTTVVDAGGSGWRNFQQFKDQVIDQSKTRILALINIVGSGMIMGPVEQNLGDMDAKLTAMRIRQYPAIIVGVKSHMYLGPEWDGIDRAVEAGKLANVPVMVHYGFVPERPFQEFVAKHLRPGDIVTHTYEDTVPMLDDNGKVLQYLLDARKRGVLFDVGHGTRSFFFTQAVPAIKQGFTPDSISSDLTSDSMNAGMQDMLTVMSKFLNLGETIQQVILESTSAPALAIKRRDLGTLAAGSTADVAILSVRQGNFGFVDTNGFEPATGGRGGKLMGTRKLECELTVRNGKVVWDLNGISRPDWDKIPRPK